MSGRHYWSEGFSGRWQEHINENDAGEEDAHACAAHSGGTVFQNNLRNGDDKRENLDEYAQRPGP